MNYSYLEMQVHTRSTGNALFLKTILDQLRLYANFEDLSAFIQHSVALPSLPALYSDVLLKWEHEVGSSLCLSLLVLLLHSRSGLSEAEVVDLFQMATSHDGSGLQKESTAITAGLESNKTDDGRETSLELARLLNFVSPFFTTANSRLTLSPPWKKVVRHRLAEAKGDSGFDTSTKSQSAFFAAPAPLLHDTAALRNFPSVSHIFQEAEVRTLLVKYFSPSKSQEMSLERCLEEYPFLLAAENHLLPLLRDFLCRLDVFKALYPSKKLQLFAFCKPLQENGICSASELYSAHISRFISASGLLSSVILRTNGAKGQETRHMERRNKMQRKREKATKQQQQQQREKKMAHRI